jgi:hypothetical protein
MVPPTVVVPVGFSVPAMLTVARPSEVDDIVVTNPLSCSTCATNGRMREKSAKSTEPFATSIRPTRTGIGASALVRIAASASDALTWFSFARLSFSFLDSFLFPSGGVCVCNVICAPVESIAVPVESIVGSPSTS